MLGVSAPQPQGGFTSLIRREAARAMGPEPLLCCWSSSLWQPLLGHPPHAYLEGLRWQAQERSHSLGSKAGRWAPPAASAAKAPGSKECPKFAPS
mmetsp:Transcript_13221/g.31077  ORF Transcript_13221/g.31077 Transcript_13221/m.31077 type:complete len:95 (-) Transcript_13221:233-517(-)